MIQCSQYDLAKRTGPLEKSPVCDSTLLENNSWEHMLTIVHHLSSDDPSNHVDTVHENVLRKGVRMRGVLGNSIPKCAGRAATASTFQLSGCRQMAESDSQTPSSYDTQPTSVHDGGDGQTGWHCLGSCAFVLDGFNL